MLKPKDKPYGHVELLVYGDNLEEAKELLRAVVKPSSREEPYITNILVRLIWLQKALPQWRDEKGRFTK